ncbi:hypothetical protein [Streptomyces litchfieldiae]|uniref:Lipoprotein n=1 Tax=Streptomyces litchfieldiae TaxID=3075543 RepID=A0ABU2MQ63_9ACTN|nr:hypothetical protein [Streptomyces sp. DSM 44938]MDT0343690.1 hypothetical protein [Streptomyces sp. DSM 44938]
MNEKLRALGAAVAVALMAAGCSSGDDTADAQAEPTPLPTPSASTPSPTATPEPADIELEGDWRAMDSGSLFTLRIDQGGDIVTMGGPDVSIAFCYGTISDEADPSVALECYPSESQTGESSAPQPFEGVADLFQGDGFLYLPSCGESSMYIDWSDGTGSEFCKLEDGGSG